MKHRITYLLFFVIALFQFSCKNSNKNSISIEGEVIGLSSNKVRVFEVLPEEIALVDSASIINGKFKLSIKQPSVSFYTLQFSESEKLNLIAKGGDEVIIKGNFIKGMDSFEIKSSHENDVYRQMNIRLRKCYLVTDSLSKMLTMSVYEPNYEVVKKSIDSTYNSLICNHRKFLETIIKSNSNSIISIMAFYETLGNRRFFDNFNDFDLMTLIYKGLNSSLKENLHVESFNSKYQKVKDEIESSKKIKETLCVGKPVPKITFFTDDKGAVSTSDFKGKKLMILFWSFANQESIDQFTRVNSFAKKNNVEIFAISLNPNSEDAIRFSRKKLPLSTCVNEEKMFESETAKIFNIKSVPYFYLINPNGNIVGHSCNLDTIITYYKEMPK